MRVDEWFDPKNREHMLAYKHLGLHGTWPEGFIPQDADFPASWFPMIAAKIAHVYMTEFLSREDSGR
jgi:hypothetical protein